MWRFRALMYETVPQNRSWILHPRQLHSGQLAGEAGLTNLLKHFAHLRVLAQQIVYLLHACARAARDALSAAAIDDFMMNTLVHCHRVDDRFHTIELSFIYFVGVLLQAGERSDAGQHSHEALQ